MNADKRKEIAERAAREIGAIGARDAVLIEIAAVLAEIRDELRKLNDRERKG